jgi:hypothetical protein
VASAVESWDASGLTLRAFALREGLNAPHSIAAEEATAWPFRCSGPPLARGHSSDASRRLSGLSPCKIAHPLPIHEGPASDRAGTAGELLGDGDEEAAVPNLRDEVKPAARDDAESRYRQFMDYVAHEFTGGRRLVDDLPREAVADDAELAALATSTGTSGTG